MYCLSEIQSSLGILYFYLLNLTTLDVGLRKDRNQGRLLHFSVKNHKNGIALFREGRYLVRGRYNLSVQI